MHDANGTQLKVGDKVLIPAVIRDLCPNADYCNVTVVSTLGRKPDGATETITLNTAVLVKASSAENALGV